MGQLYISSAALIFFELLFLPLTFDCAIAASRTPIDLLRKNSSEITTILDTARKCLPKVTDQGITLCTGAHISGKILVMFKQNSNEACKTSLEAAGYSVLNAFDSKRLTRASWETFDKSTKNAETLHQERLVLFRKTSTGVDCLHEYIHVQQQTGSGDQPLSPVVRSELLARYEQDVNKTADWLAGRTVTEQDQMFLQAHMDKLREFANLAQTLDEKDAHYTVLQACHRWWKCSDDDVETSLANLVVLGSFIPDGERDKINEEVRTRLKAKLATAAARVKRNWKPLDDESKHFLNFAMTHEGTNLNEASSRFHFSLATVATDQQDQALPACDLTKREKFQLPPDFSARKLFARRFLYLRLTQLNPTFCGSAEELQKLDHSFKTGQISRKTYDQRLLELRAMRALADLEYAPYSH